jgi:translation initiation factor 2B subunit (eIF-2B alpha/beta/delta family)
VSWEALHVAATDRSSGSATVAARAAAAFLEIAATLPSEAIVAAARTLVHGQPVMGACLRLADAVVRGLEEDGPPGARRAAEEFEKRLSGERVALDEELRKRLPTDGVVLTVSASSTVLRSLSSAAGLRVICAVSEPGGEGRGAADMLRGSGIDASVILDGAVAQQSTRADMIVFGADAIGPNAFLNKTGTLAAALGARSSGRPCLCAAGTTKLVGETVWPDLVAAAERLTVEGVPVFEEVPATLVTTLVTESGVLSSRGVRRLKVELHPQVVQWLH